MKTVSLARVVGLLFVAKRFPQLTLPGNQQPFNFVHERMDDEISGIHT
jgi:hypothetical protein